MSLVPALTEMFARATAEGWDGDRLLHELSEREALIADALRMAGRNLGADPAFVAKAIVDIGIGGPYSPEEVNLINLTFAERLAHYRAQQPPEDERGN